MIARGIEQSGEEGRGAAHLRFELEPFEAERDRGAMLADARGDAADFGDAIVGGLDHEMAERLGQGDEIALGIDDHLLDEPGAAFDQAAQQMRLARARIALDEKTSCQQFLEIEKHRCAGAIHPHVNLYAHAPPMAESGPAEQAGCGGAGPAPPNSVTDPSLGFQAWQARNRA